MAISDLDYTDDSDVSLIRRTRMGDADAYGLLHRRHAGSARALAWRMSRSASDADDLVSEGFARVLSALQRGAGPEVAFRPYLLSTIRRLAYDRTDRERRESPVEYDLDEPSDVAEDPVVAGFERDTAAAAFASLPERWRLVLWHTEVEGQKPAEVAQLLGIKPNAVAALAYRAREGLRQAYLTEHATGQASSDQECRLTNDRLASYIRGGLAAGHEDRVRRHLDDCEDCRAAYLELANLNTSLRGVVALALLGPAAASAYLSELALPTLPALLTGGGVVGAPAPSPSVAAKGALHAARVPHAAWMAVASVVGLAAVAGWVANRPNTERIDLARQPAITEPARPGSSPVTALVDLAPLEPSAPSAVDPAPASIPAAGPEGPVPAPNLPPGVPPAEPAVPVPAPPPATVPPTTPPTSAPPSTTVPPSTVPPSTTTTTPVPTTTVPEAAPKLDVTLTGAGKLVSGRVGTLVADVTNSGAAAADAVDVRLDLAPLVRRGLPDQPGWTCQANGPSALTCQSAGLSPGASRSIYVPVVAPEVSGPVAVSAAASAPGGDRALLQRLDLVIESHGMSARVATVDRGDVLAAGNSLVTCLLVVPADACDQARQGLGSRTNNNDHAMVPVDVDDDPATANSSRATLDLPAGSQVLSAILYTGADTSAGAGGVGVDDGKDARRYARVTAPDGTVSDVVAEQVEAIGSRYQAITDVTDVVRAGGAGTWTVGGVAVGTGMDRYGGWSLVVVVRDAAARMRSLVVLDGLTEVSGATGPVTLGVGGFVVPADGARQAWLTAIAYEGDFGTAGDTLSVGSGGMTRPAGGVANTNVFDSSVPGPGDLNRFGFDLDRFDVSGQLAPGTTSAEIFLDTAGDAYLPGVIVFAVDQ